MGWKSMETARKDCFVLVKVKSDDLDENSELVQDIAILDSGFWTNQFGHVVEPHGWCDLPAIEENDEAADIIFSPFRACDVTEAWVISKVSFGDGDTAQRFYCSHTSREAGAMNMVSSGGKLHDVANMMRNYITEMCVDPKPSKG